jgi:hypothetical protein
MQEVVGDVIIGFKREYAGSGTDRREILRRIGLLFCPVPDMFFVVILATSG